MARIDITLFAIRVLQLGEYTVSELAEKCDASDAWTRKLLLRMRSAGLVECVGTKKLAQRGTLPTLWRFKNVERPDQ